MTRTPNPPGSGGRGDRAAGAAGTGAVGRPLVSPLDARWLGRVGVNPHCPAGQLPLDYDRMLAGTRYESSMGQSPAAFAAGIAFEKAAAGPTGSYAPLLTALAEAGLQVGDGGIEAFATGTDVYRAKRTRRRLQRMLEGDTSVVLLAQAVLEFDFAGRTALIRPDAVLIVPVDSRLVVVELKGFRKRDGHYPGQKMATALEQDAVYQIALRRITAELGYDPDRVSDQAVIVCAKGRGMAPEATLHDNGDRVRTLEARITRAETRLTAQPDPSTLLVGINSATDPADRLEAFTRIVATYGTGYRPSCLQKCGAAQYCREAAVDDPARLGQTRLLARAGSISTALRWAAGEIPTDPTKTEVADRLMRVARLTATARTDAGLPGSGSSPGGASRRAS